MCRIASLSTPVDLTKRLPLIFTSSPAKRSEAVAEQVRTIIVFRLRRSFPGAPPFLWNYI